MKRIGVKRIGRFGFLLFYFSNLDSEIMYYYSEIVDY